MNKHHELIQSIHHLAADIGARPAGSAANHAALAYIRSVFEAAGLEVEQQDYACPAWTCAATRLTHGDVALDAVANAFSPPCDVTAPVVAACTVAELDAADITGKLVILYGDLTHAPLSPKSWFLKSDRDDHIITRLETAKPAAILTVQAAPGSHARLIEDAELTIPSATVPAEVGLALLRDLPERLRLHIDSHTEPGSAANLVARKPGGPRGKLVLCAHLDTKVDTPGAMDNAGGVAVLLTLAQQFATRAFPFDVEWIAFNGEESLPLGDDEYVRREEADFERIRLVINVDGAGHHLSATSIAAYNLAPEFQARVEQLTEVHPGIVWVEPWPESNHSTFTFRGIPALAFTSAGLPDLAHRRDDTADRVSPEKLADIVALIDAIVTGLSESIHDRI